MKSVHKFKTIIASSVMLFIAGSFVAQHGRAADSMQYVVLFPGTSCSIAVGDVSVRSFRILIPTERLDDIANSTGLLRVHVCECALLGGDPQKCAIAAITKAARRLQLMRPDEIQLSGRIFIFIDDTSEFVALYSALSSTYPPLSSNLAWQILHDVSKEIATSPASGGMGDGAQIPPNGPQPPMLPPRSASSGGDKKSNEKQRCELERNLCVNPSTREPSAEFELKCEGMPTIVVSTDGKAGLKIGPLEVSFSAASRSPH